MMRVRGGIDLSSPCSFSIMYLDFVTDHSVVFFVTFCGDKVIAKMNNEAFWIHTLQTPKALNDELLLLNVML